MNRSQSHRQASQALAKEPLTDDVITAVLTDISNLDDELTGLDDELRHSTDKNIKAMLGNINNCIEIAAGLNLWVNALRDYKNNMDAPF